MKLQAQLTDDSYSIRSLIRWCQFIRQGREDLHDDPRAGHPPTDLIDITIVSALEREAFHSAHSLAEIVGVSYSIVIRHLRDSLGTKNFHFRWVPHQLTPDLRLRRREICGRPLLILEARELDSFRILVTGDESWLASEYQHSAKWSMGRDEFPTMMSQTIGTRKVMSLV
jgi:hypothetical protein